MAAAVVTFSSRPISPSVQMHGTSTIHSKKDNKPLTITIQKTVCQSLIWLNVYAQDDEEQSLLLGTAFLRCVEPRPRRRAGLKPPFLNPEHLYARDIGGAHELVDKIYLETIASIEKNHYKEIGTRLIQATIECSYQEGFQGRVVLETACGASPFHYKMGFRSVYPENNTAIARQLEEETDPSKKRRRIEATRFTPEESWMTLPEDSAQAWESKIRACPIFQETLAHLPK